MCDYFKRFEGYKSFVILLFVVLEFSYCGGVFVVVDIESNDDIFIIGFVDNIVKSWVMNLNDSMVIYKGYIGVVMCFVVDGIGKSLFIGLVDYIICLWDIFIGVFIRFFKV